MVLLVGIPLRHSGNYLYILSSVYVINFNSPRQTCQLSIIFRTMKSSNEFVMLNKDRVGPTLYVLCHNYHFYLQLPPFSTFQPSLPGSLLLSYTGPGTRSHYRCVDRLNKDIFYLIYMKIFPLAYSDMPSTLAATRSFCFHYCQYIRLIVWFILVVISYVFELVTVP